jgi:hypothetical protein
MGLLDDPLDPHAVERLRRSIVMLGPGQSASIERERAVALLDELLRLQDERKVVTGELRSLLDRMQGVERHPSRG